LRIAKVNLVTGTQDSSTYHRTDIHPTLAELLPLAAQGNLIPIYRELPADLDTPVSVYLKLAGQRRVVLAGERRRRRARWGATRSSALSRARC
ncbi:MAG: hypothetical protein MZV65_47190, partial [Chromatiales bacterium]|nr:hypothetical protein [Chromatiales bacterium]